MEKLKRPENVDEKLKNYFKTEQKVSEETMEMITWFIYQMEENRCHDLF